MVYRVSILLILCLCLGRGSLAIDPFHNLTVPANPLNSSSSGSKDGETNKKVEETLHPLLSSADSCGKHKPGVGILEEIKETISKTPEVFVPHNQELSKAIKWVTPDNILSCLLVFIRISILVLIFTFIWRSLNRFISYYIEKHNAQLALSNTQKAVIVRTLVPIIRSVCQWILAVLGVLLVLTELSVNVTPIIYSFSVLGLAVGIGSQSLVKDIINGVMTLFEGNIAVGEVITIGNNTGVVESISLRCVHLRYMTGELQTISFSEANQITNRSRDYSVAVIQCPFPYKTKVQDAEECFRRAFSKIENNSNFKNYIKGKLKINGINSFNEHNFTLDASIKIVPDPKKLFTKEFYKVLLIELQELEVPLPS